VLISSVLSQGSSSASSDFQTPSEVEAARKAVAAARLLPGGFTVGEQVYWCGASHSFANGDRAVYGGPGEAVKAAGDNCIAVRP